MALDSLFKGSTAEKVGSLIGLVGKFKGRGAAEDSAAAQREAEEARRKQQELQTAGTALMHRIRAESDDKNARIARENLELTLWETEDLRTRGLDEYEKRLKEAAQLKSTQLSRMTGNGVLIGSRYMILEDTDYLGMKDANRILDNMDRAIMQKEMDAKALENQIDQYRTSAMAQRLSAIFSEEAGAIIDAQSSANIRAIDSSAQARRWADYADIFDTAKSIFDR